jgi:hypothetical protein
MRFRRRCRPLVENLDSRWLLSSSGLFSGLPGGSFFQNLFGGKPAATPSVISGQAQSGPLPGEIDLVAGYGIVHPLGTVSVSSTLLPTYVLDVGPEGSTGYIPILNKKGSLTATITFTAPNGATLTGTPQVLKYVETRFIPHGTGAHETLSTRTIDRGKATLTFPNGAPAPGGPAVHFNLVMTSTGKK